LYGIRFHPNTGDDLQRIKSTAMAFSPLSMFGLLAVTAMLVCYALEDHNPWFVLAFAGSCVLGSIYGFLQGAWPFGLVEAVWSAVAVSRWLRVRRDH
jgi:hypothetical protein